MNITVTFVAPHKMNRSTLSVRRTIAPPPHQQDKTLQFIYIIKETSLRYATVLVRLHKGITYAAATLIPNYEVHTVVTTERRYMLIAYELSATKPPLRGTYSLQNDHCF